MVLKKKEPWPRPIQAPELETERLGLAFKKLTGLNQSHSTVGTAYQEYQCITIFTIFRFS